MSFSTYNAASDSDSDALESFTWLLPEAASGPYENTSMGQVEANHSNYYPAHNVAPGFISTANPPAFHAHQAPSSSSRRWAHGNEVLAIGTTWGRPTIPNFNPFQTPQDPSCSSRIWANRSDASVEGATWGRPTEPSFQARQDPSSSSRIWGGGNDTSAEGATWGRPTIQNFIPFQTPQDPSCSSRRWGNGNGTFGVGWRHAVPSTQSVASMQTPTTYIPGVNYTEHNAGFQYPQTLRDFQAYDVQSEFGQPEATLAAFPYNYQDTQINNIVAGSYTHEPVNNLNKRNRDGTLTDRPRSESAIATQAEGLVTGTYSDSCPNPLPEKADISATTENPSLEVTPPPTKRRTAVRKTTSNRTTRAPNGGNATTDRIERHFTTAVISTINKNLIWWQKPCLSV